MIALIDDDGQYDGLWLVEKLYFYVNARASLSERYLSELVSIQISQCYASGEAKKMLLKFYRFKIKIHEKNGEERR